MRPRFPVRSLFSRPKRLAPFVCFFPPPFLFLCHCAGAAGGKRTNKRSTDDSFTGLVMKRITQTPSKKIPYFYQYVPTRLPRVASLVRLHLVRDERVVSELAPAYHEEVHARRRGTRLAERGLDVETRVAQARLRALARAPRRLRQEHVARVAVQARHDEHAAAVQGDAETCFVTGADDEVRVEGVESGGGGASAESSKDFFLRARRVNF